MNIQGALLVVVGIADVWCRSRDWSNSCVQIGMIPLILVVPWRLLLAAGTEVLRKEFLTGRGCTTLYQLFTDAMLH